MDALTLGALARGAGVNPETIRYYERRGLLAEPPRTPAGYRRYSAADADRVALIVRAKDLGFTLAEIGDLLAGSGDAGDVLAAVRRRLAEIDDRSSGWPSSAAGSPSCSGPARPARTAA